MGVSDGGPAAPSLTKRRHLSEGTELVDRGRISTKELPLLGLVDKDGVLVDATLQLVKIAGRSVPDPNERTDE